MDYEIKMTPLIAGMAWHCLNNSEARGAGTRMHAGILNEIRDKLTAEQEANLVFQDGSIVLNEDRYKYFKDLVDKKIEEGIPGSMSVGYVALVDAIGESEGQDGESET